MNKFLCYFTSLSIICSLLISSVFFCNAVNAEQPIEKTQLQIREYQTRIYDDKDIKMIMRAVINTLQDDGYILDNVNNDLGLITATKEIQDSSNYRGNGTTTGALIGTLIGSAFSTLSNNKPKKNIISVSLTANISELNKNTKIRLNFSEKYFNIVNEIKIKQIEDVAFYQEFFSKLDKSLFIQKQGI